MQSKEIYQHARLNVFLSKKNGGDSVNHYFQDESLPVDGFAEILYPREPDPDDGWWQVKESCWRHSIPFRDESKDGPWFAYPDADKWKRCPIWKWTNAPNTEDLTLRPSYGMRDGAGWEIHCWIRSGDIDLL
jgi:hypothetical protein